MARNGPAHLDAEGARREAAVSAVMGRAAAVVAELPAHQAEVCLFLLNSGLRSESEAVELDWGWEIAVPELDASVFLIPGDTRNNEQDHVCVLNSAARSIIERCRGKHPSAVFTYRGKPLRSVNNSAWLNARKRAIAKYEERMGEPAPERFRTLHVHDLRSWAITAVALLRTTPQRSYASWSR